MEVAMDTFAHALKSAHQAKVLRIKLTQKATACLTLDVIQVSWNRLLLRLQLEIKIFLCNKCSIELEGTSKEFKELRRKQSPLELSSKL